MPSIITNILREGSVAEITMWWMGFILPLKVRK